MTLDQGVNPVASLPPYGTTNPQPPGKRAWIWWIVAVTIGILITVPVWNLITGMANEAREEAALDSVVARLLVPGDWQELSQRRTTALLGFCAPSPQPCPTEQRRYQLPDGAVSVEVFRAFLPDAEWDINDASCTISDNATGGPVCSGTAQVNGFDVYLAISSDLNDLRELVNVTASLEIEPVLGMVP